MERLEARDLTKVYGGRKVVSGVDLDIHPGEVVGLLGPNGAGKTTTFYMIVGLIKPDAGRIIRRPSSEIEAILGYAEERELIHRDNLVLLG